jgi:hypothetical protein
VPQQTRARRGIPAWAILLIVLGSLVVGILVLAAVPLIVNPAGQNAPPRSEWHRHVSAEGRYEALFPFEPRIHKQWIPTELGKRELHTAACAADGVSFEVAYFDANVSSNEYSVQLERGIKSIADGVDGRVTSQRAVQHQGFSAIDATIMGEEGRVTAVRSLCVWGRFYILINEAISESAGPDFDFFVEGVKLRLGPGPEINLQFNGQFNDIEYLPGQLFRYSFYFLPADRGPYQWTIDPPLPDGIHSAPRSGQSCSGSGVLKTVGKTVHTVSAKDRHGVVSTHNFEINVVPPPKSVGTLAIRTRDETGRPTIKPLTNPTIFYGDVGVMCHGELLVDTTGLKWKAERYVWSTDESSLPAWLKIADHHGMTGDVSLQGIPDARGTWKFPLTCTMTLAGNEYSESVDVIMEVRPFPEEKIPRGFVRFWSGPSDGFVGEPFFVRIWITGETPPGWEGLAVTPEWRCNVETLPPGIRFFGGRPGLGGDREAAFEGTPTEAGIWEPELTLKVHLQYVEQPVIFKHKVAINVKERKRRD